VPGRPHSTVFNRTLIDADRASGPPSGGPRVADDAAIDELALAATKGDSQAVGRLYDQLVGPVHRYVSLRLRRREDAEDVTQLVFERVVAGLPKYRHGRRPFAAWTFRIARNAVIDHLRRTRPDEPLTVGHDRAAVEGVEMISLRDEEIRELRTAIRDLTPDQQEALALRFAADLSAEEAAQVMGRRAGTVRGLTFRAIAALRRRMEVDDSSAGRDRLDSPR
jgi:RNA polymerase sigma-70 factor (ECF subfamily)